MTHHGPTTADNYLQEAAQAMVLAAHNGQSIVSVLKKRCPHIHRQITEDAKHPGLLTLWGRSCNVDENVGRIIVPCAILQAIGELTGVPVRGRFVHAGLAHTYGYLFSLIETPYGPKRDRWVTTDLENGFGLDPTLLGDRPHEGTLLGNLTWFLGQIVFRGQPDFNLAERDARTVSPQKIHFDYQRLQASRITERTTLAGTTSREVVIFTDLVPFPNPPANPSKDSTLLIYSVQRGLRSAHKLITAFPITSHTVKDLKTSARSARKVRVRLRYNAYVPGLFGRDVWGHRSLAERPD